MECLKWYNECTANDECSKYENICDLCEKGKIY